MARSIAARISRLARTAQAPRWGSPLIIALGITAALLEGAGMFLFIPLLESLGATSGGASAVSGAFTRVLAPIPDAWRVPALVIGLCVAVILKNVVAQANYVVTRYFDGLVAHRLRTRVLRQTVDSCIDYRVENRRSDIVNTIATNTWKVGGALTQLHHMAISGSAILVFLILLILISPALTLIAAAFLGTTALIVMLISRRAQRLGQEVVDQNKAFGLRMWESLGGLRLIRSFAREREEMDRFDQASDTLRRRILKMEVLWGLPGPVSEISGAILIGLLILAGYRLEVGLPALAAFLALLYRMQRPVREILSSRVAFDAGFPAVEDVADYLERTAEPFLVDGDQRFVHLQRGVEFRDVTFRYSGSDSPALDRVSIRIPKGKTTAIVGRSGSGKSTLMDLLFRFRDPTEGEILVDDAPLYRLEIRSWRERLSIMSQTVYLLNDSIAANIGYGKANAEPEEIRRAAEIAGAAVFIEALPDGYDTLLGDEGFRLSGGQRQRIALARTILRNPDILLLDEATNALDAESERLFQSALRTYREGRTLVVIAHRLTTVEDADQVVMLDSGRVVECGPPEELLAANGPFARLHRLHVSTGVALER